MAITRDRQSSALSVSSGTTGTVTWPVNPTAGSTVLLFVQCAGTITSVTDNGTTPATLTQDKGITGGRGAYIYRANNITLPSSGSYHVTITTSSLTTIDAGGWSYLGMKAGAPDATNSGTGTGTSVSSGSAAPAAAGGLVFGGFSDGSGLNPETVTFTGTSPLAEQWRVTNGSSYWPCACADALTDVSRTLTWTLGDSVTWGAVAAAYSPAGTGGGGGTGPTWDPSGSWNMIFSDEFPGTTLDTTKWQPGWFGASGITPGINSGSPQNNSANVTVSGGYLNLQLTSSYGGLVTSNPNNSGTATGFQTGPPAAFEARINLPQYGSGVANWCAWWTDGQNWPGDGEIDILESLGSPDWNAAHVHDNATDGPGGTGAPGITHNQSPPYGWHTFGCYWKTSSNAVEFFYDGASIGSLATDGFTSPQYLILVNTYSSFDTSSTMQVDWVRVWTPGAGGTSVTAGAATGTGRASVPTAPSAATTAAAVLASGTGHAAAVAAGNITSSTPVFGVLVDWNNDGDFGEAREDVTARTRTATGISITYGRDQARAFSPARPGEAAFSLNNQSREYSPENTGSPLYGQLVPGRPVKITAAQDGAVTVIYRGFLDDYTLNPNRGDQTVTMSCLDLMARFAQANPLSTPLLPSIRTGTAIGLILEQLGWPSGARDLDPGASVIPWWWEEGTDGLTALGKMLAAEGPPAACYVDTAGNFVFRDRHHRYLRSASSAVQATFTNGTQPETTSRVTFSQPMSYDTGWRDICNTIIVPVGQRAQRDQAVVWQSDSAIAVPAGQAVTITAQASDPFTDAAIPVRGTDFTMLAGTATATLNRTSGQSAAITLTDSGSGSIVTGLQLRACPVAVSRTVQVSVSDAASAHDYGVRGLPSSIDLSAAAVEDAVAVATIFVTRYAQRQPIVTIPVSNLNASRLSQQLARDIGDRIHITDSETGMDDDFFIEQISHATSGSGRLLTTTFGCEKAPATSPASLFIFDSATSGKFDTGKFGT